MLQAEIHAGKVFDIVFDRLNGAPPPTLVRHNWAGHEGDDTVTGKARIDTFLVSFSASHVNNDIQYQYSEASSFDHIPIFISSYLEAFSDTITVATQPAKIHIRKLQELSARQRADILSSEAVLYVEMWAEVAHSFEEALNNKDIDLADRIWSSLAERFLWRIACPYEQFPSHMPPRAAQGIRTCVQQILSYIPNGQKHIQWQV